ncbi:MAG: hypothetical protein J7K01_04205, partial [Thermovirga sp.]|nr:hypothetical protein [Thermovirga sp.]
MERSGLYILSFCQLKNPHSILQETPKIKTRPQVCCLVILYFTTSPYSILISWASCRRENHSEV